MAFVATSCNKDDNDGANCRVTKQTDNSTGVITSVIYRDGKLYRVEQSNGNSGQITLNAAGMVERFDIYNGTVQVGYVEFTYASGNKFLEKRTYQARLLGGFDQKLRDVYEYTGSNVTKITNYDLDYSTTSINGYITYQYDAQGNVTSESQYGRDGSNNVILQRTISYQYDNKPSPAGDLGKYLHIFNENNITVRTTVNYFPNTATSVDSIEYIYNGDGYPTKVTTFKNDGGVDSYDVQYDCN